MLSEAIAQKARGEDCEEKSKEVLDYLKANELAVQPYYDVFYASVTVASILSTHWDRCSDEKCDEVDEQLKNDFGRQISESFVSARDEVKLRYRNIVDGSYEFYLKNADGSYLGRFVEGKDYEIDCVNGTVKRTRNSAFPDFTKSPFYGLKKFNHNDFEKRGNKDYIIYVDYKYDIAANVPDAFVAENAAKELGCPYADANLLWNENLAAGKRPEDLLSNGINHPADYGHYLYYLALKQLI